MNAFTAEHAGARVRPSPNFGERREACGPDMIVLHYTGMDSGEAAEAWLCDPRSQVSSHYLVHEDGGIVQMVREADRAWHAGASCWHGRTDLNSASVGIEIVNPGHALGYRDFPEPQIASVIELCRGVVERHRIPPERILAHSDIAPGRKIDPGERFPWPVLAAAGIGRLADPSGEPGRPGLTHGDGGPPVLALQSMLSAYGYDLPTGGTFDDRTAIVVSAFQRHFRPACVDGVADASTIEALRQLLASLKVEAG